MTEETNFDEIEWEVEPDPILQDLLEHQSVIDAFNMLEREAFETAATRPFNDDIGRLRAITQVHGLRDLKSQLEHRARGVKATQSRNIT